MTAAGKETVDLLNDEILYEEKGGNKMAKYVTVERCVQQQVYPVQRKTERCAVWRSVNLPQYFPKPGWVEHDAEEIWASQLGVAVEAMNLIGGFGGRHCGNWNYKSERDSDRLGQKYRRTGVSCDRLAVPKNIGVL